jgi:hypothetical protein
MRTFKTTLAMLGSAVFGVGLIGSSYALTCPKELLQDEQGHWYSYAKPGWKSPKPTPKGVSVKATDDSFGGVIYSPKHQRLACVYRASNGKWLAVVSDRDDKISVDKQAIDDTGKNPAWRFSDKYKDYACGRPYSKKIDTCKFMIAGFED